MMSLQRLSPQEAKALVARGATIIDVREVDEHVRERIPGAINRPLSRLANAAAVPAETVVVFHCRSGARTSANGARLAGCVAGEAYVLEGGLEAWKTAGLPVIQDRRQPIEIMRQVQIAAGGLVLVGIILGATLSPYFYVLSAFVGAGLVFAGMSGTCAMARALSFAPWNRRRAAPAA
jgi:rhodanese-related sulfurtransferase